MTLGDVYMDAQNYKKLSLKILIFVKILKIHDNPRTFWLLFNFVPIE